MKAISNNQMNELGKWLQLVKLAEEYKVYDSGNPNPMVVVNESTGEITMELEFEQDWFKYVIKLNSLLMRVQFTIVGNPYHDAPFSFGRTNRFLTDAIFMANQAIESTPFIMAQEPDPFDVRSWPRVD